MGRFFNQAVFILRFRYYNRFKGILRKLWYKALGMQIGENTNLPHIAVTWPHQVSIGKDCRLEDDLVFKFDGIWKPGPSINIGNDVFIGKGCEFNITSSIHIGDHTLIASGCRFIDHDHGLGLGQLINKQQGPEAEINLGKDVWLGCNVIVLKGVHIGEGAVVAAGAVVNKSISAREIWGGIPAKKIGIRS